MSMHLSEGKIVRQEVFNLGPVHVLLGIQRPTSYLVMLTYSDLPFDVIHHLCSIIRETEGRSLNALSLVDRQTRLACIPLLFTEIIFDQQLGEKNTPADGFVASIHALLANVGIKEAVKSFHFQPRVANAQKWPIPDQFFDLIFSLPNLLELAIILRPDYMAQVKGEFNYLDDLLPEDAARRLPKLRSLSISSPGWIFLTESFPNLESLVINTSTLGFLGEDGSDLDIVRLGRSHPNLKSLHCDEIGSSRCVQEIALNLPQIEDLGLYGQFYEYEDEEDKRSIMDNLKAYCMLGQLKHLSLPSPRDLGMGFRPPMRGNLYLTNPGLREKLKREREERMQRLMDGISSEVIAAGGSYLCGVTIGKRDCWSQELWEKGEDGRLFASKSIERSQRTQKVVKVGELNDSAVGFQGFEDW